MSDSPRNRRLAAVTLALGVIAGAATAGATQRTWSPGGSPCGPLLQNCINFAASGDTINIAFSGFIAEDPMITKSLTLRAAAGHTPQFVDSPVVTLFNEVTDQNVNRLEGLGFDRGRIQAIQGSIHPFEISLRNIWMGGTVNSFPQVQVRVGQPNPFGDFGHITATIEDSRFTVPPVLGSSGCEVLSLQAGEATGMTAVVRRNVINHFDGQQLGAIAIFNNSSNVVADVICNEIRGDNFNSGVHFDQQGPGTAQVRILGNLVSGQVDDAGAPAAFGIGIHEGSATFEIVNNTAVHCDTGIRIAGADEVGAMWSGIVSNNIVATISDAGFEIEQPNQTQGIVENDHNLVYETGTNFFIPGPGTVFAHPQFVSGDHYHIEANSPARNAGNDARVPAVLTLDLDGNARKIGRVDIGADESTVTVSAPPSVPGSYALLPNIPNPFNPTTVIRYQLPQAERVFLGVYDAHGNRVCWLVEGEVRGPGMREATWDGRDTRGVSMASGIYFYRLTAGPFVDTQRMVLVR